MEESTSRWVSPNEMMQAAQDIILDGRVPVSKKDYALVMNFMASNMNAEVAEPGCQLMAMMFDMPLARGEITDIVQFQNKLKEGSAS